MWAVTKKIEHLLPRSIKWKWIKGYQVQQQEKWRLDIAINNFIDSKVEMVRAITCTTEQDHFYPKYICGISHNMTHIHGRPRLAITADSHELLLQEYIQFKTDWNHNQFHPVDWGNF